MASILLRPVQEPVYPAHQTSYFTANRISELVLAVLASVVIFVILPANDALFASLGAITGAIIVTLWPRSSQPTNLCRAFLNCLTPAPQPRQVEPELQRYLEQMNRLGQRGQVVREAALEAHQRPVQVAQATVQGVPVADSRRRTQVGGGHTAPLFQPQVLVPQHQVRGPQATVQAVPVAAAGPRVSAGGGHNFPGPMLFLPPQQPVASPPVVFPFVPLSRAPVGERK